MLYFNWVLRLKVNIESHTGHFRGRVQAYPRLHHVPRPLPRPPRSCTGSMLQTGWFFFFLVCLFRSVFVYIFLCPSVRAVFVPGLSCGFGFILETDTIPAGSQDNTIRIQLKMKWQIRIKDLIEQNCETNVIYFKATGRKK